MLVSTWRNVMFGWRNVMFGWRNVSVTSLQHSLKLVSKARKKYLKNYLKNIYIKKATSRIFFLFFK